MTRTNFTALQGFKWTVVFLLWLYVASRAVVLSFTHDEAYSFLLLKTNYLTAMAGTANTHWLNSLGMKLGSLLLGDEEWMLRLGSVLAWPLYGISALRISSLMEKRFTDLLLFCALVFNPYLLDFFSLARGYGLQLAFLLAALWQAFRLLPYRWDTRSWTRVFAYAAIAVFANYSALHFFLSLLVTYVLLVIAAGQIKELWPLRISAWWAVVSATCVGAISNLLFIKYYSGDLEFGFADPMYALFETVVAGSLYAQLPYTWEQSVWIQVMRTLMLLAVFSGIVIAVIDYRRRCEAGPLLLIAFVICFFLLQSIVFHYCFNTPYLAQRTALLLYPMIMVLLFFSMERIPAGTKLMRGLGFGLQAAFLILIAFNFFRTSNFTHCHEWKFNGDVKPSFNALQRAGAEKVLVSHWYHGVWTNYYRIVGKEKYRFQPGFYFQGRQHHPDPGFRDSLRLYDHAIFFPPYEPEELQTTHVTLAIRDTFPTGATIIQFMKK